MKKFTFILLITVFISVPGIVFGFTTSEVINHQVLEAYFYPQEFDKLVMDLTIPSGRENQEDILKAITIQNTGTAVDSNDIYKIKIWQDKGKTGFQGIGIDEELGTLIFYSQNNSWYINNLNSTIPTQGLRIFISIETSKYAATYRTIQMRIPLLFDGNGNKVFDVGDLGIFMDSQNNGPTDQVILNSGRQTIWGFIVDNLAPKTVIIEPKDNSEIITANYLVKGLARDQGGSTPQWVKIGINDVWHDVTSTGSNFAAWEYNWQNITEGTFILKTQSADWMENVETPGDGTTVTVVFPAPPAEEEIGETPPSPEATEGKAISEMTVEELKVKISEIQQKIIELLTQLIQFIQSQISQFNQ